MLWDGRFENLAGLSTLINGIKPLNLLCANLFPNGNNRGPLECGTPFFTSMNIAHTFSELQYKTLIVL